MGKAARKLLKGPDAPQVRRRVWRSFGHVLGAAKPHWKPMVLSFVLMAVNSAANKARLVVVLPIFTQVLELDKHTESLNPGEGSSADQQAKAGIDTLRQRGGWFLEFVEDAVGGVANLTGHLVHESWYAGQVDHLEGEAKAEAAAKQHRNYAILFAVLLLMLLMIAIMCSASYFESYLAAYASLQILMDVRERAVRRVLSQPVAFFDKQSKGELVQRVLGDVGGYGIGLNLVFNLVRVVIDVITTLFILIAMAPALLLMALVAVPFLLPIRKLSGKVLKRAHKRQAESVKVVQQMLQMFSGIRTVKSYASEDRHARAFRETDEQVTRRGLKVQRAKSSASALITFLNNALIVILVLGGGWAVFTGRVDISPTELFIAMFLLSTIYQPIKRAVKHFNNFMDSMASIERATEYMELEDRSRDAEGAVPFPGIEKAIQFQDVDFAYVEGEPVLQGVDFEIPRGHTVALVGPSGGGKSTICDLLLGFYQPTGGRIAVDGADRRGFQRASFLERTAIVSQTPFLFHSTIAENIRQSRLEATDAQVEAAAKAANIHDAIVGFPLGYGEVVGEEGVRLSGGQRQRITIARALVRDPEILVLDEATASLDTASEKAVQDALDHLREGRTTLVVAHRLSTIRSADQILVVQAGRIVERGTHEALIEADGEYARLVRMQDLTPDA